MIGWPVNKKLGTLRKKTVVSYFKVLFPNLPTVTEESHEKPQRYLLSCCVGKIDWLTDSKELSHTREAASCVATQDFPKTLLNSKVHYRVHKSPLLAPSLSHINPVYTTTSYLRSILISSTHLRLGLHSNLFPSGFPANITSRFLFSPFVLHSLPI
jgi:hypothetical protein